MNGDASPAQILDEARRIMEASDQAAGVWPRTTAVLGRLALEAALGGFWARRAPGLEAGNARAQLLCLLIALDDRAIAARAGFVYAALSGACHYHPYELAPTAAELSHWLADVDRIVEVLADA